jgi:hypothetical protein
MAKHSVRRMHGLLQEDVHETTGRRLEEEFLQRVSMGSSFAGCEWERGTGSMGLAGLGSRRKYPAIANNNHVPVIRLGDR